MRFQRRLCCFVVVVLMLTVAAGVARAAALRSTARNQRNAVMEYDGFFMYPLGTEPEGEGDLAPPQLFELVRPNDQPIKLGRLYTSCVCVALEAEKTDYAQGEKVVLRLRNIRPSPPEGMLYAIYAQITSPVRTVLRFDTFLQSTMFLPSKPGEAPTRGDIVADGVLTEPVPAATGEDAPEGSAESSSGAETTVGEDGIEIIVPKADNYIPDTSEYGLRKQAEAEAAAKAESEAEADETANETEADSDSATAEAEDNGPIFSEVVTVEG